jgi:hypothetical protein
VLFTGRKSQAHATAYGLGPLAALSAGQRMPRSERAGVTPAHWRWIPRGATHSMIRRLRADRPRISEVRSAVHENRLLDLETESVRLVADWLFENSTFWVWEEDGAIQGFSAADPRDGSIFLPARAILHIANGARQRVIERLIHLTPLSQTVARPGAAGFLI